MDLEVRPDCRVTVIHDPLHAERTREPVVCRPGQWLTEVLPAECLQGDWVAVESGRVLARAAWHHQLLVPGLEIVVYPRLAKGDTMKIITGIVFPPLGVYWALRSAGLPTWAAGLLTGGVGILVEQMVAGKPGPPNVPTSSSDLSSSNTYGFSGITNGTRIGAPIPVVYGEHRVGGQLIAAAVRTDADNDVLHLLYAMSEGPVSNVHSQPEINQQPLSNYTGVTTETRDGLNVQPAITIFGDKSAVTFEAATTLTTSFATYTSIGTNLTGLEVNVLCPSGLFRVHAETGKLINTSVSVEVDYKLASSGTWLTGPRVTYTDSRRAALRRTIRVDGLAAGRYDIRIRRTTAESTNSEVVNTIQRASITELVNDGYTYPNTALLAVKAVATNQLSGGLPRVTTILNGMMVKVWTVAGLYRVEYSRNPAWVVFDMLTNERYGHGRFTWKKLYDTGTITVTNGSANFSGSGTGWTAATLRKGDVLHAQWMESGLVHGAVGIVQTIDYGTQSGTFETGWDGDSLAGTAYEVRSNDIDLDSFVEWAAFCDGAVPNGSGGFEARATCDFVFDADRENIWSAVLRICSIGQASPVKIGNYIRIKIERAAQPVQLFTMANIKTDTFEETFLSLKDRANIFEVQYLNRDTGYGQDVVVLEDPLLITNSEQPRRKTVSGYGVTRSSHAARLARFNRRVNQYVTRTISFEAALEAVTCEPGDVIRFQHDVPQWGYGGRALIGSTSTTIVLDRSVVIESGKTYEVLVRHADDAVETHAVTTAPGTVSTLTIAGPWNQTPAAADVWAFGETTISTKPFRIISIERTQDLDVRISALEYNAAVYDDSDTGETNPIQYSALGDMIGPPGNVLHLTMLEQIDITQSVWVSWSPPGSPHFKAGRVYRTDSGIPVFLGEATNGSFAMSDVASGELVRVIVTSVSTAGVESSLATAPTAELVRSILNPPDVQGLVLEGERLRWSYPDPPRDLDGFLVRFRPGNSTDWAAATAAHEHVLKTTDFQIFKRQGSQTFLVKAVDIAGNESLNAKALTVSYDGVITDNIVLTSDHRAFGWPGTITNGSIISGDIKADSSAVFWTGDDALMWSASSANLMWSAAYDEMTYEFTVTPTADQLDAMLKLQVTMTGLWSIQYQAESSASMWNTDAAALMWSGDSVAMWADVGPYMQWPGQIDHLRVQPYKIKIVGHSGTVQAVLQQLAVILDVRDLLETIEDVPISAIGTRLALTQSYREIVMVRTELADDGGSAAYVKVMDKHPTLGPLIKAFTSSNVATTAVIDAVVHGY